MEILLFVLTIISTGFLLYEKFKIEERFTMFLALSSMIFLGVFFGCFKVLKEGTVGIYITLFGGLLYSVVVKKEHFKKYISNFSVNIFLLAALIYLLIYTYKEPFFCAWDEFSHWGPYLKNIKETHQLHIYTNYEFVHPTYPQAMTILYYIGSFFEKTYSERNVMLIYSLFIHSCMCVLIPNKEMKADRYEGTRIIKLLFALFIPFGGLLFPYIGYAAPYVSAYMDVILSFFFGACMLFILENKKKETIHSIIIAILLFVLLQIKDIGITFYMICVATYLIETIADFSDEKNIYYFTNFVMCGLAIPLAGKKMWNHMLDITNNNVDQFANSNLNSFIDRIKEQIHGTNNYLIRIGKAYWEGILNVEVMWTGTPILVIAIILILVGIVLSYLYCKKGKKYICIYALCAIGYFTCYLIVLFAIYLCGMSEAEALSNASMDRYIGSFLNGWSFVLCGISMKYLYANSKGMLRLALVLMVLFVYNSVLLCDIPYVRTTKEETGFAYYESLGKNVIERVETKEKIWLMSNEDNLQKKYIMAYEMYPVELERNLNMDFKQYNIEHIIDIMKSNKIQYIYILEGKELFMEQNNASINIIFDAKSQDALFELNGECLEQIY